jgi:putative membrane protein
VAEVLAGTSSSEETSTELSKRRTGMSFQRTRMSADRTLMSIIRTSLSLISFGFTIYQAFKKLQESGVLSGAAPARHFGVSLVLLGIGMLILGIIFHLLFMTGLRAQREEMRSAGLIYAQSQFPPSLTLIVAVILLIIGIVAAMSMVLHTGPFS